MFRPMSSGLLNMDHVSWTNFTKKANPASRSCDSCCGSCCSSCECSCEGIGTNRRRRWLIIFIRWGRSSCSSCRHHRSCYERDRSCRGRRCCSHARQMYVTANCLSLYAECSRFANFVCQYSRAEQSVRLLSYLPVFATILDLSHLVGNSSIHLSVSATIFGAESSGRELNYCVSYAVCSRIAKVDIII